MTLFFILVPGVLLLQFLEWRASLLVHLGRLLAGFIFSLFFLDGFGLFDLSFIPPLFIFSFCVFLVFLWIAKTLSYPSGYSGGSEPFLLIVLIVWLFHVATVIPDPVARFAKLYLMLQLALSYFLSGFAKLVDREWRSGVALRRFLEVSFVRSGFRDFVLKFSPSAFMAVSRVTILTLLLLPVFVFSADLRILGAVAAISFHTLNAYLFGLNRFLIVWGLAWFFVLRA